MASGTSEYLENKIIDHVFRNIAYTVPSAIYVALTTTTPVYTDTGSTIVEPSGGSYARVQYGPSSSADWESTQGGVSGPSTGSTGETSNHTIIVFPTATGSWGTLTGVAILDNSSGGNMLYFGDLTSTKLVGTGDVFEFDANQLSITLS